MTGAPSRADATRAVLLAVRLSAVAPADVVRASVGALGVEVEDLEVLLGQLERAGLLELREGGHPGWRLTDDGRSEGERLLAVELDGLGARPAVTAAYELFLTSNGVLLRVCTDWQLIDANPSSLVVNDHTDPAYDRAVIERLAALHDVVVPICARLAAPLPRFGSYAPRFTDALERIRAGDRASFDRADLDSYHSIWFELHEHLLATLGIDRSTEPLPDTRPPAAGVP